MSAEEATRKAFAVVKSEPAVVAAELAWRWTFGLGTLGVLLIAARQVRDAFALSGADEVSLGTGDVQQRAEALARMVLGALPYLAKIAVVVLPGIALLWLICATLGRTPVTRVLVKTSYGTSRPTRWGAMAGIHAAKVFLLLVLFIGYASGALAGAAVIGNPANPRFALATVMFLAVFGLSLTVWSWTNFVVSLAPIFVLRDGRSFLDSLVDAIAFARLRTTELAKVAFVSALLRTVVAVVITGAALSFLVGAKNAPAYLIAGVMAALTVSYCAVSDWLLLARLEAYVLLAGAGQGVLAAPPAKANAPVQ